MIVIASIHQPSTNTLMLFDNVLLLSEGNTVYYGPPGDSIRYFESQGYSPSTLMSPAEFMLELTNSDFANGDQGGRLETLINEWETSPQKTLLSARLSERIGNWSFTDSNLSPRYARNLAMQTLILFHRMALVHLRRQC